MSESTNSTTGSKVRRWWWVARYAVRFFAPRIARLLVDLVTVPVFLFVAVSCFGLYLDRQEMWSASDWMMVTQGAALISIAGVTSCTLTILAVLFDWVHTTRRAILTICASFFMWYLLIVLIAEASRPGHGFLSGLIGVSLGLGFQEVTSRVRPFKRDSWNGKSLRERWTARQNRLGAS